VIKIAVKMAKMLTYHRTEAPIELTSPDCSYNVHKWIPNDEKYTCFVKNQIIEPGRTLSFPKFTVMFMDLKKGVRAVEFSDCKLFEVPQSITGTFVYLEVLSIRNCFLKEIDRNQLSNFKHLKQLYIVANELTSLPADLFKDLPNIEAISFYQNKITSVDYKLLEGLNNLKYADFRQNVNINCCYAIAPYSHPNGDYYSRISSLSNLITLIEMNSSNMNKRRTQGCGLPDDIRKFIAVDKFKDLKIYVANREFKVHKFLMIARSSTLAAMLQDNSNEIQLTEFSPETFEKVLEFMYNESFPVDDENIVEVYEAAGKELIETINDENALKILFLSCKFSNYDLKMKAFNVIKKMFPDKKFKDELADDPETIKKMLFVREKLEKEFENLGVYE
jgi:BTB/POZ domain/Leucine rich repeat